MTSRLAKPLALLNEFAGHLAQTLHLASKRFRRQRYVVVEELDGYRLHRRRRGGAVLVRSGTPAELAHSINARFNRPVRVDLRLAGHRTLARKLRLPAIESGHLSSLISLQIERSTPWAPGNAVFAYRASPAGPRRLRPGLDVSVLIASRPALDSMVSDLARVGLKVVSVGPAGDDLMARPSIDLLSAEPGVMERLTARTAQALLATVLLIAVSGAWGIWHLHGQNAAVSALHDELMHLRNDVAGHIAMVQAGAGSSDILTAKREAVPSVVVLEALSHNLPDGTYLTALNRNGSELSIEGYSGDAGRLIEALEATAILSSVHFASTVYFDHRIGAERFAITAQIAGPVA